MLSDKTSYVFSINGLFLSRNDLSPTIVENIDEFINLAPTLAENVRASLFDRKDTYWFIQHMNMVHYLLKSVSAKWLLTEAASILRAAEANQMNICRKKIDPFLSDFLSLSIEMQLAQKRAAEEHGASKKSVTEAYTDVVNVLTAALHLISANEYDKARELFTDMDYPDDDAAVAGLMQSLQQDDSTQVEHRVNQLRDTYLAKIEALDSRRGDNKKEIMAVDDRPDILLMVAGVLRDRYKILTAAEGQAALKILEVKTPDLFILDIDMPGMNGFELAQRIRQLSPFSQTPILFLTSNSTREYVLKAIESGGNDFIVKPANQNTLRAKVGRYL